VALSEHVIHYGPHSVALSEHVTHYGPHSESVMLCGP
jgi:hypothetical protein